MTNLYKKEMAHVGQERLMCQQVVAETVLTVARAATLEAAQIPLLDRVVKAAVVAVIVVAVIMVAVIVVVVTAYVSFLRPLVPTCFLLTFVDAKY